MSTKSIAACLLLIALVGVVFVASRGAPPAPAVPQSAVAAVSPDISHDDTAYINPFRYEESGPQPRAVVAMSHYEFGRMALGSEQSYEFEVRNEGDAPLRLAKGKVQCKCTVPTVGKEAIPPGGSVKILLTWKPVEATPEFAKSAEIWTNDPDNRQLKLSIRGGVFDDPGVSPANLVLGEIPSKQVTERHVIVYSGVADDLEITACVVDDPKSYEATFAKLTPDQLREEAATLTATALSGYRVDLKVLPSGTLGPFQGWVTLKLNRGNGEKQIDFSGYRIGPISIHGPDYQGGLALVDLKRFKSQQGAKTKLFLRLEPFGKDLQIEGVTSTSGSFTAALTKKSMAGSKEFYELILESRSGIPIGTTYTVTNPDRLVLKTNHPEWPEIQLNARYIVQ